jgi:hypothetical protein
VKWKEIGVKRRRRGGAEKRGNAAEQGEGSHKEAGWSQE